MDKIVKDEFTSNKDKFALSRPEFVLSSESLAGSMKLFKKNPSLLFFLFSIRHVNNSEYHQIKFNN